MELTKFHERGLEEIKKSFEEGFPFFVCVVFDPDNKLLEIIGNIPPPYTAHILRDAANRIATKGNADENRLDN